MSDPITVERMENAMEFLSVSDDSYAVAKTDVLRAEILAKRTRARVFMTGPFPPSAEKLTGDMRKSAAETHDDVIAADDELLRATLEYESLRAKRQRAELLIDVFRTVEASRRKS
jgi:hypothetical protein